MRPTVILMYGKKYNPTSEVFPLRFKELLPLKLKNSVSFKGLQSDAPKTCLQPMMEMFECFKKNEFNQTTCSAEILAFNECSAVARKEQADQKLDRKTGKLTPYAQKLTTRQANVLLKKYPQHNDPVPDRWPRKQ